MKPYCILQLTTTLYSLKLLMDLDDYLDLQHYLLKEGGWL